MRLNLIPYHLLTFNLKDFPDDVAAAYGIQVVHPDQWLSGLIAVFKPEVHTVTLRLLTALKSPPLTPAEFCAALERLHLPDTARLLRDLLS